MAEGGFLVGLSNMQLITQEKTNWKFLLIVIILAIIVGGAVLWYMIKLKSAYQSLEINKLKETNLTEEELRERIGQMILVGFRGTEISDESYITKVIKDLKIGGVVLFDYDVPSKSFPRNILNPEQTKKLISDLQSHSSPPLFVAVDVEGGEVNRLKQKYGFLPILSPREMGQNEDIKITTQEAEKIASELKELGFNMNLAPVVDVDINPENPIIGGLGRSFSSNPEEVVEHAKAFIEVHKQQNIITVAKHFPGHGSSKDDSHLGMVDVTETYKEEELIPYQELNREGLLDAVMTAHIINRKIDKDYPATLSSNFLQEILRKQINFKGVIISDDMQMNAIASNYGFEEAIIKAINAGCDIIGISNNSTSGYDEELPYKTLDVIYRAVKEGKIPIERITESYGRIYNLKKQFGIIE
jgi:beta-N-acetylhexosaminidase